MEELEIRGMAHITGGGFYENIPRMFPQKDEGFAFDAVIRDPLETGSWAVPPIFARIASGIAAPELKGAEAQEKGAEFLKTDKTLRKLMFNTYNMGIGFVLALSQEDSPRAIEFLDGKGFPAWEIGRVEMRRGKKGELRFG
jgi:phosphoribosylformylglycinamidine cyclo-ligase